MMSYLKKKIGRIRTGGQSGVDRAAMDYAREMGIPLCGWCPKNGWAEDYTDPPGLLSDYPELSQTPSEGTEQRTKWNMRDCDAILTIIPDGSLSSPGTDVGLKEGESLHKPMYTAYGPEDVPGILTWLRGLPDEIELCIGGPRASECPDAYDAAMAVLKGIGESF
ncbi:MAG: putative molybdenum carrier protein [Eubacteriales bacterium]|nr:putative molybdenum carrier protein [Eubacteriales bacterium]